MLFRTEKADSKCFQNVCKGKAELDHPSTAHFLLSHMRTKSKIFQKYTLARTQDLIDN